MLQNDVDLLLQPPFQTQRRLNVRVLLQQRRMEKYLRGNVQNVNLRHSIAPEKGIKLVRPLGAMFPSQPITADQSRSR